MFLSKFYFYFPTPFTHICAYRAHDSLFDAVHPLLQAIGSYAGCYVSLIAGDAGTEVAGDAFFTA